MASQSAARGQVAKLTAGADAIEIKATIPERQVAVALGRYGLTEDNDEERYIYFFDTPALDLLAAGIIARARRVVGDEHDSTIKFRPVDPAQVPNQWRKYRGFKIEADASEKNVVKSASFTMPVAKGLIKRVVAGEAPIAALFSQEQQLFLFSMANRKIDSLQSHRAGAAQCPRLEVRGAGLPVAAHRRAVAPRGWRDAGGSIDQGADRPGRGRHGGLHGVSRGGRRGARQPASRRRRAGRWIITWRSAKGECPDPGRRCRRQAHRGAAQALQ